MNRSQFATLRCIGTEQRAGGCGRWLVKYDPATKEIVEVAKRIKRPWPHWRPSVSPDDPRIILDGVTSPDPYGAWEYDPRLRSLVESGTMIDPDADVDGSRQQGPPDYYVVRCSCGRRYEFSM